MSELQADRGLREELEQMLPLHTPERPLIVSRRTLQTALQRSFTGQIDIDDLISWANMLELSDEVQYEPGFETLVADVLFCVSTPELNGPLDLVKCRELISQLGDC